MHALSLRLRFAVEPELVGTDRCELLCECVPSHPFFVKSKGNFTLSVLVLCTCSNIVEQKHV